MKRLPEAVTTKFTELFAALHSTWNDLKDEIYNTKNTPIEGKRVLAILQKKTGYLGSMPDVSDLSENYKDYLDLGDKADLTGTKTKIPVTIERKAFTTAVGITIDRLIYLLCDHQASDNGSYQSTSNSERQDPAANNP